MRKDEERGRLVRARRGAALAVATAGALAGGCARAPAERVCPELAVGALVLTELTSGRRGESAGWLELYNAGAEPVDLVGVRVRLRRLDGGAAQALLVRHTVEVDAGAYAALSLQRDEQRPAFAAYGLADGEPVAMPAVGAVSLESCERTLDEVRYARLPTSLAPMAAPPRSAGAAAPAAWCEPASAAGSPGQENGPCR
jgi:hypothetical protein